MSLLQHLDTVELNSTLNANYACQISEDGRISILTEKDVIILTMRNNLSYTTNYIAYRKDSLKLDDYALPSNVDVALEDFYELLPKDKLFEAILSLEMSGPLTPAVYAPTEIKPTVVSWSPAGLQGATGCVIAVQTTFQGLSIYTRVSDEEEIEDYVSVANIADFLVNVYKPQWRDVECMETDSQLKYAVLRERINSIACKALTWTHVYSINGIKYSTLLLGHLNGSISAIRVQQRQLNSRKECNLEFMGNFNISLPELTALCWYKTDTYEGALVAGNMEGNIITASVSNLEEDKIQIDDETSFFTESDQIKVESLQVWKFEKVTYIFACKQSFLVIFAINEDGLVVDNKIYDVGNLTITGCSHYKENILVIQTLTGVFKKLYFSLKKSKISMYEEIIPVKIDWIKHRSHGFIFTKSKVLFGFLAYTAVIQQSAREKFGTKLFLFNNTEYNPLQTFMDDKCNNLARSWDCIETLRLLSIKEKRFPWMGLDQNLNYDKLTLLELKKLRLLAIISEKVYALIALIKEYNIKSFIIIHYLIDIKLAINRIHKLLSKKKNGQELTVFQMRSIDVQNMFLKEMVLKGILEKANVGERYIDEMSDVIWEANNLVYPDMPPCCWCGQKIIGPSCIPPHADSRCAISMMQLPIAPGYKCPLCKSVVHKELDKEYSVIFCPYCDHEMEPRVSVDVLNEDVVKQENISFHLNNLNIDEKTTCFEDCLSGDVDLDRESLVDNDVECVLLSDNEDEEKRQGDFKSFFKLSLRKAKSDSSDESEAEVVNDDSNVIN